MRIVPQTNNSIYVLYLPYKEFQYNINLNDDEYISSQRNTTVNYIGGKLNYFLPENCTTVINLGDFSVIDLNLCGNGTLEFRTNNQSKITIIGTMNLESINTIHVNNKVKNIEIQNINVTKYVEFHVLNENNEPIDIKIENLTLLPHSKSKFSYAEICNTLLIKQTATLILDYSVSIANATVIIDMIKYQNDLIPMLTGEILEPPKSIIIQQNKEETPKNLDDEYLILDGKFDCDTWTERMKYNNTYVGNARCVNNNLKEARMNSLDQNRAFITFGMHSPVVKKETYMPKGMIAIIVFSACDFCLLVFLILFFAISIHNGDIILLF